MSSGCRFAKFIARQVFCYNNGMYANEALPKTLLHSRALLHCPSGGSCMYIPAEIKLHIYTCTCTLICQKNSSDNGLCH